MKILDAYYDYRLGIYTADFVSCDELGTDRSVSTDYCPMQYIPLRNILINIHDLIENNSCVDYGSGMGRVVFFAATYQFRRCIGIEISSELHDISQKNLQKAKDKDKKNFICKNIELLNTNAMKYIPEDDVSVFFLFNPFKGEVLNRVMENIRISLEKAPRKHAIIYIPPADDKESFLVNYHWITKQNEIYFDLQRVIYICQIPKIISE